MVHVHVSEDVGYRQRVGDVGLAAAAGLAVMGLLRVEVGAAYQVDLIGLEIVIQPIGKDFYTGHATLLHPAVRVV